MTIDARTLVSVQLLGALSLLAARQTVAETARIDIGSAVVDTDGTATVEVILHSGGHVVGALANRFLFDTRVIRLAGLGACTIDPGIGSNSPGCKEDPPRGLCLVLNRNIINCGEQPDARGCNGEPAYMSEFIGLIFDRAEVPPREIPDGSTLFRCKFDVVDVAALPTVLKNVLVDLSDPFGNRIEGTGSDGLVSLDPAAPPTRIPVATPTPGSMPTATATARPGQSAIIYYRIDESREAGRVVLSATLAGENVGGVQNDLVFDGRVLQPSGEHPCRIDDAVSDRHEECDSYPIVLPCLGLSVHRDSCAEYPWIPSCQGQAAHDDRLRVALTRFDVSNETPIPNGAELFTCSFDIINAGLLPASILLREPAAESPQGNHIEVEVRNADSVDDVTTSVLTVEGLTVTTSRSNDDGCAMDDSRGSSGWWISALVFLFALRANRGTSRLRRWRLTYSRW